LKGSHQKIKIPCFRKILDRSDNFQTTTMNYLIIFLFATPTVLAILIFTTIVKYLKSKAIIKRNFQIQIQIDLAVVMLVYVISYSSMFIACEIFGPTSSVTIVKTAFWMIQCLFNIAFNCIIALEFIQLYNIFSLTILDDFSDSRHLLISQIFVFVFGIIIGSGLCSAETGSCKKTAIYNHFITDNLRSTNDKFSFASGITWISYGSVIFICQVSIEVKRFLLNKADQKADNLALIATKQIQEAVSKLNTHLPIELGIHNLYADGKHSEQEIYPCTVDHLKETVFTRSQKIVAPASKISPSFFQYQKCKALESEPAPDIEMGKNYPKALPMLNTISQIVEIEVIPINAVNQTLDPVKNAWKGQSGNDQLERPTQNSFNVWQKNEINVMNNPQQIPHLMERTNKLSRERVNL
jgi:hypothetical protein